MPITAAEVESNGWVLRLTLTGSLTSPNTNFGAYTLDPDGSPRVVLTSLHPGFVKFGSTAVPGDRARSLVATLPLRKPVNPASPTVKVLEETDLGGGSIRVRLALSEHIYATDTNLSLAVLAGWRTGESAQSGISVTNNSTVVAPIPIFRWALAPYETTPGAFRVSLLVFSHHPVGFEPAAAVKFTATDGTNTKTVWTAQLDTDNSYGDNLRCYTAIIDPATAPALTAGLLRVDAEVYPWLGPMRSTDPAGTRSMASIRDDGYRVEAERPWVIGYDPAGTRYGQMLAYVDPVNGTTTPNAAMVATTLAGAKAVAPGSRPRDIRTAEQAGYLVNRTLAAANGQAAATRSVDGMNIVLAPGVHVGGGSTSVTTGIQVAEIPLRIVGDPDDADPRANCILQTGTGSAPHRADRVRWQNLTIEAGTNLLSSRTINMLDNVTVRGKAGQETNSVGVFSAAAFTGFWSTILTRTRWWRFGGNIGGGSNRIGLVRNCEFSRQLGSHLVAVKNRFIGDVEDGFVGAGITNAIFGGWVSPTLAGQAEDIIVGYNDIRRCRGRVWDPTELPAAIAGTPNPSLRRVVFFGNVCERIGSNTEPHYSLGENDDLTISYTIIEANTFVGERANTHYSDPPVSTIADTNTKLNQAFVNRVANNAFDWLPTKHDDFLDPSVAAIRGTSDGYRPHMVEAWSMLFGVMHEGNYDAGRHPSAGSFPLMTMGLRGAQVVAGAPNYMTDGSIYGPGGAGATGGGNYLPAAGSPLLGRVTKGNSDRDINNSPRATNGAAGAIEAQSVMLAPSALVVSLAVASGVLSATPSLAAASLAIAAAVAAGTLSARAGLAGEALSLPAALSGSIIIASLTLAPASLSISFTVQSGTLIASSGFAALPPAKRTIIVRGV